MLSSEDQVEVNQKHVPKIPQSPRLENSCKPSCRSKIRRPVWSHTHLGCVRACLFPSRVPRAHRPSHLPMFLEAVPNTFPGAAKVVPMLVAGLRRWICSVHTAGEPSRPRASPGLAPRSPLKSCQTLARLPAQTARGRSVL